MKAVIVTPGQSDSGRLADVPEPKPDGEQVLVRVLQVGIDATDAAILAGEFGEPPPGDDYLILGHESFGRVESSASDELNAGDLVVAMVRRPDPLPCVNCAAGEWDMCLNGMYTERGIKGLHGFLSEYYAELPEYLVRLPEELIRVGVLLEPLTIVEKALDQIARIQSRLVWTPRHALVLGAGPVGLLAATALRLEGLEVDVYDRNEPGPKSAYVEAIGAGYVWSKGRTPTHELTKEIGPVDIVIEATGYSPLAFAAVDIVASNGIVCLTGVSGGVRRQEVPADHFNLEIVLGNKVLFGSVNANRRHFDTAVRHLRAANERWPGLLETIITRRLPIERWHEAAHRLPHDIKAIIEVNN